jgi:hypothetical protein
MRALETAQQVGHDDLMASAIAVGAVEPWQKLPHKLLVRQRRSSRFNRGS